MVSIQGFKLLCLQDFDDCHRKPRYHQQGNMVTLACNPHLFKKYFLQSFVEALAGYNLEWLLDKLLPRGLSLRTWLLGCSTKHLLPGHPYPTMIDLTFHWYTCPQIVHRLSRHTLQMLSPAMQGMRGAYRSSSVVAVSRTEQNQWMTWHAQSPALWYHSPSSLHTGCRWSFLCAAAPTSIDWGHHFLICLELSISALYLLISEFCILMKSLQNHH